MPEPEPEVPVEPDPEVPKDPEAPETFSEKKKTTKRTGSKA